MAQASATTRTNAANHARLVQEITALVVIAVIVLIILVVHPFGATSAPTTTSTPPISTTFNSSALQQTQARSQSYPDVTPAPSDLGKTDPFAQ